MQKRLSSVKFAHGALLAAMYLLLTGAAFSALQPFPQAFWAGSFQPLPPVQQISSQSPAGSMPVRKQANRAADRLEILLRGQRAVAISS